MPSFIVFHRDSNQGGRHSGLLYRKISGILGKFLLRKIEFLGKNEEKFGFFGKNNRGFDYTIDKCSLQN
jgi:hypothetical protein